MFRSHLGVAVFCLSLVAMKDASAGEDSSRGVNHETAVLSNPSLLVRLKSGINYPEENAEVTHYRPIALDGLYRLSQNFSLGLHLMHSTGNHAVTILQGSSLAGLNLAKTMVIPMVSGNYFFEFGQARVAAGLKAGVLFYSDTTTLSSGLSSTVLPPDNSNTLFTAGPSLSVDLPLKGAVFATIGGDYMISQNYYEFGSLYVGLGFGW